jgi:hypothetical protein
MPTLPLVKRSVLPQVQQAAQASPEAAGLEGRALANMGGQVAQVGGEMFKVGAEIQARKQKLEIEANVADYELSNEAYKTALNTKVADYITSGGSYKDVQAKVYEPERQKFLQELSKKGYNKAAWGMIQQRIQIDGAIADGKMAALVDKMRTEDYVETRARFADSKIESDFDGFNAIYDDLKKIKGEEWVNNRKASVIRDHHFRLEVKKMENDFEGWKKEYDSTKYDPYQNQLLTMQRQDMQVRLDKMRDSTSDKTFKELLQNDDAGLLTAEAIQKAAETQEQMYGVTFPLLDADQANVLRARMANKSAAEESRPEYRKALQLLMQMSGSQVDRKDINRFFKSLYTVSDSGNVTPMFSVNTTDGLLRKMDAIIEGANKYDPSFGLFNAKKLSVEHKEMFKELTGTLEEYTRHSVKRSDVAIGIQAIEGHLDTFLNKIEEGKPTSEIKKWMTETLAPIRRESARERIEGSTMDSPRITTVVEYDALPSGATYIGPDGIKRTKK